MPHAAPTEENIRGAITKVAAIWQTSRIAIPILPGATAISTTGIRKPRRWARSLSGPAPSAWKTWLATSGNGVLITTSHIAPLRGYTHDGPLWATGAAIVP